MKIPASFALALSLATHALAITPVALRCENREAPHGIDVTKPRPSWIFDSGQQSAYQAQS